MTAFKDEFIDEGGRTYLSAEEKAVLVKEGATLPVTECRFDEGGGYKGKDRFLLAVDLEGESRLLSFDAESVPSRVRLLNKLAAYFNREDAETTDIKVVLADDGRTQLIELV
jgi:hypothetical protein